MFAWLPVTEDDLVHARVWLAWCELGRSEEQVGHAVAEAECIEERLISHSFPAPLGPDDSQTAAALVRGLRAAVCAGQDPMPLARAHELLARWAAPHLANGSSGPAATGPAPEASHRGPDTEDLERR